MKNEKRLKRLYDEKNYVYWEKENLGVFLKEWINCFENNNYISLFLLTRVIMGYCYVDGEKGKVKCYKDKKLIDEKILTNKPNHYQKRSKKFWEIVLDTCNKINHEKNSLSMTIDEQRDMLLDAFGLINTHLKQKYK